MDIAAMSTVMSMTAVKQAASIQVLNMAKSQAEVMGTQMAECSLRVLRIRPQVIRLI